MVRMAAGHGTTFLPTRLRLFRDSKKRPDVFRGGANAKVFHPGDDFGTMTRSVKHSFLVMFLFYLVPEMRTLAAQGLPPLSRVAPDQPGCVDSKFFPKISACRIDNCEKKDSDHRDI